ncbi:6941_t:CDS:2, partial [Cetraspora pellucida]
DNIHLNSQDELVGVIMQFQQIDNNDCIINDFYIFNQIKAPDALNMALDLKCEDEFIDRKKSSIESANKENMQVQISDSIVNKHHRCPSNKQIKASSESNVQHDRTNNKLINIKELNKMNKDLSTESSIIQTYNNESKHKYIFQAC